MDRSKMRGGSGGVRRESPSPPAPRPSQLMSTLYLASDPRSLADRLADALDADAKTGDFFAPTRVVVPNRFVRKWLRLWLARKLDVAINLTYQTLEEALWQFVQQVDPSQGASPPEAIDSNVYRLMVLSVLLEEQDPALAPLQRYVQMQSSTLTRLSCRRAWYLADRVGALLQEYEYHRQDAFMSNPGCGMTSASGVLRDSCRAAWNGRNGPSSGTSHANRTADAPCSTDSANKVSRRFRSMRWKSWKPARYARASAASCISSASRNSPNCTPGRSAGLANFSMFASIT